MEGTGESFDNEVPVQSAAGDEKADLWTRLKQADNAEQFATIWLEIQCGLMQGVRRAVVVLGPKERGPFAPVAVWPVGMSGSRPLAEAVEQAITQRESWVRTGKAPSADQSKTYDFIAAPVMVNDKTYGGVAFEIEHDPSR